MNHSNLIKTIEVALIIITEKEDKNDLIDYDRLRINLDLINEFIGCHKVEINKFLDKGE